MFRHQGKSRTFSHNLRIATLLSFVAGVVNVTGILEIQVLTTNVTGHFAYFSEQIMEHQYLAAFAFFCIHSFLSIRSFYFKFYCRISHQNKTRILTRHSVIDRNFFIIYYWIIRSLS